MDTRRVVRYNGLPGVEKLGMDVNQDLGPLKITCTSTRCRDNLHCFRLTQRQRREGPAGRCRTCGIELVDWKRVHRREIRDAKHTVAALQLELIRHHFWHLTLTEYAENYARRKGRSKLLDAVRHRIKQAVWSPFHPLQGRQTPRETSANANAVHYAQHATASCCRACLEEWHGIPTDRELTEEELAYLTELAMLYILEKIPDLDSKGQHIPRNPHRHVQGPAGLVTRQETHAH
jgi:ribosomal protein L34E